MSGYQTYLPPAGSTGTAQIADGAVTTPKLADGAVTEAKIDAVYRSMIDPLSTFPSYGTVKGLFEGPGCTDFLSGSPFAPFSANASGTGAGVTGIGGVSGRYGALSFNTGTDATGRSFATSGPTSINFGSGEVRFRGDALVSALSDGTDTYVAYVGYSDDTSGDGTDAIYFRYTHSVNSGNWVAVTRANSVETTTNLSVAPSAAAYQTYEIGINADGTSVAFYVNGALVATHTANIPTTTSRELGVGTGIRKTAGTTSRALRLDLLGVRLVATAAR